MNEKYITDHKNQFKDKVVVITGSTQGIGAETAKLFASRGAKAITICGRNQEQGLQVKKEIEQIGSKCLYVKADLAEIDKLRSQVLKQFFHLQKLHLVFLYFEFYLQNHQVEFYKPEHIFQ